MLGRGFLLWEPVRPCSVLWRTCLDIPWQEKWGNNKANLDVLLVLLSHSRRLLLDSAPLTSTLTEQCFPLQLLELSKAHLHRVQLTGQWCFISRVFVQIMSHRKLFWRQELIQLCYFLDQIFLLVKVLKPKTNLSLVDDLCRCVTVSVTFLTFICWACWPTHAHVSVECFQSVQEQRYTVVLSLCYIMRRWWWTWFCICWFLTWDAT